jgi:hypothetical protein
VSGAQRTGDQASRLTAANDIDLAHPRIAEKTASDYGKKQPQIAEKNCLKLRKT